MAAATVCLMATSGVSAMCAAIFITRGYRTFARLVGAFFGGFCVVHFPSSMSKILFQLNAVIAAMLVRFCSDCEAVSNQGVERFESLVVSLRASSYCR